MHAGDFKRLHSEGQSLTTITFNNKHDEKFELYMPKPANTLLFAGDETDWEVLPLFNKEFDIWTPEELLSLADAIKEGLLK